MARIMEDYDKAQLLLGSKAGMLILIAIRDRTDPCTYRVSINNTWLAEDLDITRKAVITNIKKLVENGYLIPEPRNEYFVNPSMFFSQCKGDTTGSVWNELNMDYKQKLLLRDTKMNQ